ncbi:MAG: hypothetical protein H6R17_4106 [Proteobacteria bacterium]|nr:hypothetical protein [Pseudomonadota bacterium]
MSNAFNSSNVQRSKEALVNDLKAIVGDADALLTDIASATSEELAVARQSIEAKLANVKTRIDDARLVVTRKACGAAEATSEYLSENPWKVIGVASLAALVAALLVSRRSCK